MMNTFKRIRCKAQCGINCLWIIDETDDGLWKIAAVGRPKRGRVDVPVASIPSELNDAVGRTFKTFDEAESHVRGL
jgi:hypothetical protein